MTLTEFLLARIAEDEAAVAHIRKDPGYWYALPWDRLLAECEAKRRIVREWGQFETYNGEGLMQVLALPYADHPDYLPDWKP
jgi:Family of unknown function (DUF6221)